MRQKVVNIIKAFLTGFVTVAFALLVAQVVLSFLGLRYLVGWQATFELEKTAVNIVHVSWFAPIIVGVIFAVIQLFDDFEGAIKKQSDKLLKDELSHELLIVASHGAWGLALGFVISMFLLAVVAGTDRSYTIPFLLQATASGSTVTATTSIITVSTVLGLLWGVWKAENLPKEKPKAKPKKPKKPARKKK